MSEPTKLKFWSAGEIRLNADNSIDEIVTGELAGVHLEKIDDGDWRMSLDGRGGRRMVLNFKLEGKRIRVTAEDDGEHSSGICAGFKS